MLVGLKANEVFMGFGNFLCFQKESECKKLSVFITQYQSVGAVCMGVFVSLRVCVVCVRVWVGVQACVCIAVVFLWLFSTVFFKYGVFTRQFVVSGRLLFPVVRKESIALETKITIIQPTTPDQQPLSVTTANHRALLKGNQPPCIKIRSNQPEHGKNRRGRPRVIYKNTYRILRRKQLQNCGYSCLRQRIMDMKWCRAR